MNADKESGHGNGDSMQGGFLTHALKSLSLPRNLALDLIGGRDPREKMPSRRDAETQGLLDEGPTTSLIPQSRHPSGPFC
jgi:hypothetical protein